MRFIKVIIIVLIGLALLIGGIVLCNQATKEAEENDVMLFDTKVNGNSLISEEPFTDLLVTSININAINTDVTIVGNQEKSYVEFINFDPNLFIYSFSGKSITISELKDIDSLLEFWENGLAFKGVRNILLELFGAYSNLNQQKEIRIYLSQDITGLNLFDITLASGAVSISDISLGIDVILTEEAGSFKASNLTSASKIEIVSTNRVDVDLQNVNVGSILINSSDDNHNPLPYSEMNFLDVYCHSSNIRFKDGSFNFKLTKDSISSYDAYQLFLQTYGLLTVDDIVQLSPFQRTGFNYSIYQYSMNVITSNATITIYSHK